MRLAVAGLIVCLFAHPEPAQARGVLDPLLPQFDQACKVSALFETFWRSVGKRFGVPLNDPSFPLLLPKPLRGFMGEARVTDGDGWTSVEIGFTGLYRRLKVKAVTFLLGKENGWSTVSLEFDEPEERVRQTLQRVVDEGAAELKRQDDSGMPTSLYISVQDGTPSLVCDFSN